MRAELLLTSSLARELYEGVRGLPIVDYHNHLDLSGRKYTGITELWISSDPYKHRLMRICGVPERLITGDAADREKFDAWCRIFPRLAGNPTYIWSLMELETVFGTSIIPSESTADELWRSLNGKAAELTAADIIERFDPEYSASAVSVLDDPSPFAARSEFAPLLRGDDAAAPSPDFVRRLESVSGRRITSSEDYLDALGSRIDALAAAGCSFADHSLDDGFRYIDDDGKNPERFAAMLSGEDFDRAALSSFLLRQLGGEYGRRGMTLQLHFGALRRTSSRLLRLAGPAGGYAAIGRVEIRELVRLLDDIEKLALPRTILFPLDPGQLEQTAALAGSFSKDGVGSVLSLGPAWWWCDHRDGIRRTLDAVTCYSVLSAFPGMTTDSRSPLSFVRHDYFRRIACEWLAERCMSGELPADRGSLSELLRRICYQNAHNMIKGEGGCGSIYE